MTSALAGLRSLIIFVSLVFLPSFVACARPLTTKPIVLENVTIIDPASASVEMARVHGRTVVIDGDRIVTIEATGALALPENARRIDGTGKFVIPALWDSHAHLLFSERQNQASLMLFMANGVTSIRDLGHFDNAKSFAALRRKIENGEIVGPRITRTPVHITDGGNAFRKKPEALSYTPRIFFIDTAEEARRLVRYVAQQKIEFIKPYDSIPRAAFFALMDEARQRGIPVGGHVPMSVTVREAAEAGMVSLEHARSLPFNCSRSGELLRRRYDDATARRDASFDGGALQNDAIFLRGLITGFDPRRCDEILKVMASTGMVYVPTHLTRRSDALARQLEFRETPLRRFAGPEMLAFWQEDMDYYAGMPAAARATLMDFYYLGLEITRRAAAAGVKILVGTDATDTNNLPGFGLHQEMYEMVGGGLTPLQVLRAATLSPAEFAGEASDRGTIAVGKKADLLLLTADPLIDILNSRKIDAVIHDGAVMNRLALDTMLEHAAALVAERR